MHSELPTKLLSIWCTFFAEEWLLYLTISSKAASFHHLMSICIQRSCILCYVVWKTSTRRITLQDVRLYAAVLAKNVVGSSQRKVLHTREWTRVPEDERQLVKDMSLQLLVSEESDQIAMQVRNPSFATICVRLRIFWVTVSHYCLAWYLLRTYFSMWGFELASLVHPWHWPLLCRSSCW